MMLPFIVPADRNLRVSARVSIPEIPGIPLRFKKFIQGHLLTPI